MCTHLPRLLFINKHHEFITGHRNTGHPQYLHGNRRPGRINDVAERIRHGSDLAILNAADNSIAGIQRAALYQDCSHRSLAHVESCLNNMSAGRLVRICFELHNLSLKQNHLQQLIDPLTLLGGYLNRDSIAAPFFRL